MDTSPEVSGENVKPVLHKDYKGNDIVLPADPSIVIAVEAVRAARNPHHFLSVTKQGNGVGEILIEHGVVAHHRCNTGVSEQRGAVRTEVVKSIVATLNQMQRGGRQEQTIQGRGLKPRVAGEFGLGVVVNEAHPHHALVLEQIQGVKPWIHYGQ